MPVQSDEVIGVGRNNISEAILPSEGQHGVDRGTLADLVEIEPEKRDPSSEAGTAGIQRMHGATILSRCRLSGSPARPVANCLIGKPLLSAISRDRRLYRL